jgi:hypothetical protein
MAKVIHVANFGLKPKYGFQHSCASIISNGFIRNGHVVSHFSERDVARAASLFGSSKFGGIKTANQTLQDYCYHIQPDLLLLGHSSIIQPLTLQKIRKNIPSIKIVQWTGDALFVPSNVALIQSKFDVVDATLVATAGAPLTSLAKTAQSTVGFLPNPVDFSVECGLNHEKELPYDLFYACGSTTTRRYTCHHDWLPEELLQFIEKNIPSIRFLLAGVRGHPHLSGSRYQQAMEQAAIGFNLSQRNDYFLYSSDRIAQMCGNGLAILIDRATGYDQLFDEHEFAFYSTKEDMLMKIRQLIEDTPYRQALAKAGRSRYHSLFNEQIIANYIFEVAFDCLEPSKYSWPTRVS